MKKILIVDDDLVVLEFMQLILCEMGFEVTSMSDSCDALDYYKSHDIDLVVSDYNMPGIDGKELIDEMIRFKKIPIIMCSGLELENDLIGLISGFIMKPYELDDFKNKIKSVLD